MNRKVSIALVAGALCALASPAAAHAMLERATPRVGSVTAIAPGEIRLNFSEGVAPALSHIVLHDQRGQTIALGLLATAPNARATLVAPLHAHLAPGLYRVDWRVVSIDSHVTQGDFTFTIRP